MTWVNSRDTKAIEALVNQGHVAKILLDFVFAASPLIAVFHKSSQGPFAHSSVFLRALLTSLCLSSQLQAREEDI